MQEVVNYGLLSMEYAHMVHNRGHRIRPGEHLLADSQVFQAKTFLICHEVGELAQISVRMTMEAVDKDLEVEIVCKWSEVTVVKCGLELTAGVIPTTLIFAKHLEHLFGTHQRVFRPRKWVSVGANDNVAHVLTVCHFVPYL